LGRTYGRMKHGGLGGAFQEYQHLRKKGSWEKEECSLKKSPFAKKIKKFKGRGEGEKNFI